MAIALSGSLVITGSIFATQGITGSFSGSATSASYADTLQGLGSASFAPAATFNTVSQSFAITSGSLSTRVTNLESTSSTVSSSFASTSGSIAGRVTLIEGQYATTGSNTFTGPQYVSQASNAISFTSTASLYTDGGLRVSKDSFVSGTAYFNNVVVYGTSSIQYITSSQVNFGTNIITVNTDTPAVRFGGLAVFDSGSTQLTGSMLWDSEKNHWIYSNPSGSTYNSAMLMNGPRNTGSLGTEQGTTSCAMMIGQGGDHITSSMIYSYGNATCFYGQSYISGSGDACFAGTVCAPSFVGGTMSGTTIYGSTVVCSPVGKFTSCIDAGSGMFSSGVTANNGIFNGVSSVNLKVQNGACANTLVLIQSFGTEAAGENASILLKSAANADNSTYAKGLISFRNNGTGYGRGDIYFSVNNGTDSANASLSDVKMVVLANGNVGIGASTNPVYMLEVSSTGGSQRIRVGTLQNNDNTPRFEAITSNGVSIANSAWLKVNDAGGFTLGQSDYTKAGGDSGNFSCLSSEIEYPRITVNSAGAATFSNTLTAAGIITGTTGVNVGANALGADRMFQVSGTSFTTGTTQFGVVVNPSFCGTVTNVFGVYAGNNFFTGTITNSYNLYIEGTSAGSATISNKYGLYQAGGSDKNYFAGDVGIGIASPSARLQTVSSGLGDSGGIRITNTGSGGDDYRIWPTATVNGEGAGKLIFTNNAGNVLTLTGGSLVGIGTTSPTAKLQINSTSAGAATVAAFLLNESVTTDTEVRLAFAANTNNDIATDRYSYISAINTSASNGQALKFATNETGAAAVERMRITSGGFLKASNTGTYFNAASYHELRVNTSGNWITYMTNTASSNPYGMIVEYTGASPNGTQNEFYYAFDTGGARFGVRSNGGIANYQANDVNLSDIRTKKDIIPLESYWDKFKAIEIVKFKYKDQTHDDYNIGVIAQQVEEVAPEFVDIEGWDKKPKLDEDGNEIVSDEELLKSIYTADLHHATIKVLQEAMVKIETLEARVKELENK